jgi:N-acetylneuraminic acid mutarotase
MIVQLRGYPKETEKMKKSGMKGRMITIASVGLVFLMALSVLAPVASAAAPSWNYAFPMGGARAQAVVAQAENGVVYVVGGVTTTAYTPSALASAYNPSTGTWMALTVMTSATRGACGGFGADGRLYVFDGTTAGTQIYNVTTNAWSAGASMPSAGGIWEAKSAIVGDHAYVFGGEDDDSWEIGTLIYNMTTDTWWTGADMPYGIKAGAVVADDDYAYYIGGENVTNSATVNVTRYSFAADSWSIMAPLPSAVCAEGAVIGPDGLVYVFGGANTGSNLAGTVYSATYTYDRESNTWNTVEDMNVARAWLGSAMSDNKILAIGGNTNVAVYTFVESLDTLQNQLANLQNQMTQLQNQLAAANNDIAGLEDDLVTANNETAQLKQQLVDLSADLNQTMIDLNAAQGSANNAKSAADSANMMGLIGIIIGIVAIVIAVVALVTKRKTTIQQMQPQPPMPPQ